MPLDWSDDTSTALTVFARELVDPTKRHEELPLVVYLQGGPGGKGPRPTSRSGWLATMLESHRVILLDQRGTGRSSAIRGDWLSNLGTGTAQAQYLSHFRADSIIADAEHLRTTIFGGQRWATIGQSYGGFLTMTYLSQAPHALTASFITGGLPGLTASAHDVYRRTYPRVAAKNRQFATRFPDDTELLTRVADRIAVGDVRLPDGDLLSVRRFQSLGIDLGMKPGFARMHWLLDEAFDPDSDELTDTFCEEVRTRSAFVANPLYAVLHESIYASGQGATGWAAQAELPAKFADDARPLLLTGEMIYPWMFSEIRALRPFEAAAQALAERTEWPALYDPEVLAANEVPVEAVVYYDDMFVDAGLSLETAARVGNTNTWVTNEFEHDGLRTGDVMARLVRNLNERGGFSG